jgi:hypothetical protein
MLGFSIVMIFANYDIQFNYRQPRTIPHVPDDPAAMMMSEFKILLHL